MSSNEKKREVAAIDFLYKAMIERDPGKRRIKPVESAIIECFDMDDSDDSSDEEYKAPESEVDSGSGESDVGSQGGASNAGASSNSSSSSKSDQSKQSGVASKRLRLGDTSPPPPRRSPRSLDSSSSSDVDFNPEIDAKIDDKIDVDADSSTTETVNSDCSQVDSHALRLGDDASTIGTRARRKRNRRKRSRRNSSSNSIGHRDDDDGNDKCQSRGTRLNLEDSAHKPPRDPDHKPPCDSAPKAPKLKLICAVCCSDTNFADNEIVQCDGCKIGVHEECYGVSDTHSMESSDSPASTTPWFCDACKAGKYDLECELCPSITGIMKETDNKRWIHLTCALYTPEVKFHEPNSLMGLTTNETPRKKFGAKECYLCEEEMFRKTGICIKCDAGMCKRYFHVTCAQKEGLLMQSGIEEDIADPFYAYCKQHMVKSLRKQKKKAYQQMVYNLKLQRNNASTNENILRILKSYNKKYKETETSYPILSEDAMNKKEARALLTCPSAVRHLVKRGENLADYQDLSTASYNINYLKKSVKPEFTVEFVKFYSERAERMTELQEKYSTLQSEQYNLSLRLQALNVTYENCKRASSQHSEIQEVLSNDFSNLWSILKLTNCNMTKKDPFWFDKLTTPVEKGDTFKFLRCHTCSREHDQQTITTCDSCQHHFHVSCLDPPLRKVPRKTKQVGWECSVCTAGQIKSEENSIIADISTSKGVGTRSSRCVICCVCSSNIEEVDLVRCDTCKLNYHMFCVQKKLRPASRKTSNWTCFNCIDNSTIHKLGKSLSKPEANVPTETQETNSIEAKIPEEQNLTLQTKMYDNVSSKGNRSHFTPFQTQSLNDAFNANGFLTGQKRIDMAKKLNLSVSQVRIWFQNRRVYLRKQKSREDFLRMRRQQHYRVIAENCQTPNYAQLQMHDQDKREEEEDEEEQEGEEQEEEEEGEGQRGDGLTREQRRKLVMNMPIADVQAELKLMQQNEMNGQNQDNRNYQDDDDDETESDEEGDGGVEVEREGGVGEGRGDEEGDGGVEVEREGVVGQGRGDEGEKEEEGKREERGEEGEREKEGEEGDAERKERGEGDENEAGEREEGGDEGGYSTPSDQDVSMISDDFDMRTSPKNVQLSVENNQDEVEHTNELRQEINQEIRQEVSQEISQEISQEVSQEISQEVSQEISQEQNQEISQDISQEIRQEISQEQNQEISQEISQEQNLEISQEQNQEISQEIRQEVSQDISQASSLTNNAEHLEADNDETLSLADSEV